jgi:hypothetical protein
MEAMRCVKRRLSDVVYRQLIADAAAGKPMTDRAGSGSTWGRLSNPARPT